MKDGGGVPPPNYTQMPNAILALMPEMRETELRVVLAIARQTFGWHKQEDFISLTRLEELTGLSRQGVIDGLEAGIQRGLICKNDSGEKVRGQTKFLYSLLVHEVDQSEATSQHSRPALVQPVDQSLVNTVDIQKKEVNKEKENGGGAAAIDDLAAHLETNDPPAALKNYQIRHLKELARRNGMTYEQVRTLWLSCKPLNKPVGAFIKAMEGDGEPYQDYRPAGATLNAGGIHHMRGTGVMYDINEIRAARAAALGASA